MSLTSWFLVSSGGTRHRLPREMIFVGRDDCELMLQSRSVDKQHAVINYEPATDEHKVKDLGSLNGTFVNDVRIQEQVYFTLKINDKLRFGYDTNLFTVVRGELHVPEEALKHEKYSSQLQLPKRPPDGEASKSPAPKMAAECSKSTQASTTASAASSTEASTEGAAKPGDDKMAGDLAALHRGTPLYGQPSWWGDGDADDENSFKQETRGTSRKQDGSSSDGRDRPKCKEGGGSLGPPGQEPSYFEIPTKESLMAESSIHEVPTKDTESGASAVAPATTAATPATPSTATTAIEATGQGHASFTIEFDDASPGKMKIRDHVTKQNALPEPRFRSRRSPLQGAGGAGELSSLQVAMIAAESKVADWLAQNDPPIARMESTEEDSKSIKSDVPVHLNRLKGSKHVDGTQSDSENGAGHRFNCRRSALEQRLRAGHQGGGASSRTSFTIQFFDEDDPRKQRSYSFSQTGGGSRAGSGAKGSAAPADHPRAGALPMSAGRLPVKQISEEEGSPAWSSASVGPQASPHGDDPQHKPIEDDNLSDKGTYTIELENQNPEEAEARRMIDKVFGVEESPAPVRPGCLEQQQETGKERQKAAKGELRKTYYIDSQTLPDDLIAVGSPRWVSQWATLAANNTRTDPEGSGGETSAFLHHEKVAQPSETGVSAKTAASVTPPPSSHSERKRRTLPQPPAEERPSATQKRGGAPGSRLRSEIGEKQDTEPQEKESQSDPDPVGGASRTEGVATKEQRGGAQRGGTHRGGASRRGEDGGRRRRSGERGTKEKPLVRQGSFTIDRPSANVPQELIPRISHQGGAAVQAGTLDTATLLKDTQAVMAFLEAKLREEPNSPESDIDTESTVSQAAGEKAERKASTPKRRTLSSLHREKSAATANANARERKPSKPRPSEGRGTDPQRRPAHQPAGNRARRQPSLDLTDDDITSSLPQSSAFSDVLSSDQETGSAHQSRGPAHFASSEDLLHSKYESSGKSVAGHSPKPPQKSPTPATAGKPATLPRPRPTRASLLRRARHGDASDSELADADRVSVASEVSTTSSTSQRPPSGRKGPSRIDVLAQPRRTRLGSLSARSDSEATPTRSRVSAETLLRLGLRSGAAATPRTRANSVSKLPDAKAKFSSPALHSTPAETPQPAPESAPAAEEPLGTVLLQVPDFTSSRWRRLPPEYASTSEDEFGSNRHPSKHSRLRPGSTHRGTGLGGSAPPTPGPLKGRGREQEEYIRDWTAHSEEIARISQDLAKDLAMLAREIHDVAGEIDSVSSSTAPSTTVSTAATTPGSALDTREELVDRVFDESLNFRKTPPTILPKAPEINGRAVELRPPATDGQDPQTALRRRTWNRDEAVLDSLMLTSVSQLSAKIRQNVDKTAGKIRILFKDKDRNWEEIEGKLKAEGDVPLLKTSNREISSILQELKRVEKQLQVINVMVDPDGTLDALASLGLTSPTLPKPPTPPGPPGATAVGNGAARGPLVSAASEESERDFSLPLNRFTPSGEENSLTQE